MINSLSTDFVIRLKNGNLAGRKNISAPVSKFSLSIAELLKKFGYISDYQVDEDGRNFQVKLAYINGQPKISDARIYSKPGRRYYQKSISLPWGMTPDSLIIVSTSKGVVSQKEARKLGVGGEIIAEIF